MTVPADSTRCNLWDASPRGRLAAARALTPAELDDLSQRFLTGCPKDTWPYGCSTAINPWIVFLGPSPGASPAPGDPNYLTRIGHSPTAGTPPASMVYHDPRGYFDRLRELTVAVLRADGGADFSETEALALSGMMNLDSGASGKAQKVTLDRAFARWALDVSVRCLRPRYVVGVGLGGFVQQAEHRWLLEAIGAYVGNAFHPARPHQEKVFEGYPDKRYLFRAWHVTNGSLGPQHFILFPQHPSRAPMTSPRVWTAAVREFVTFVASL